VVIMTRQYICSTCAGDPRWTTEFYRARAQDTGALAIEKRLRPGHPFGRSLPERERRTTVYLAEQGLPVARLCPPDYYDAWSVISEFVGPNLRWLTLHGQTSTVDAAALWLAAAMATAKMAAANVMVTDWASRNVAYPLTGDLSGRVRVADPHLLDHAFTQCGAASADVQKGNIWMRADQDILAPEVRRILREEQAEALQQVKAMSGGAITQLADLASRPDCEELFGRIHLGKASLQARLRDGSLDPDRAMQHAIGHDALTLLSLHGERLATHQGIGWLRQQQAVFRRMSAELPADRFDSLADAARALASGLPELPAASTFSLPTLDLEALIRRPSEATRPLEADTSRSDGRDAGTLSVDAAPAAAAPPGIMLPAPVIGLGPSRRQDRLRRVAVLATGLAAMVALSVPAPRTLDDASIEVARRAVTHLAEQAGTAAEPVLPVDAIRGLVGAARDPRPAVSHEAARHLAALWRDTQDALFRALLSRQHIADADLWRLVARARAFADAGYLPAVATARLLAKAAACGGTTACLRQAIGRLQALPPKPLAGSPPTTGVSA
jgi:hypothetical protein